MTRPILVSALLVLIACGGGDDDDSSAGADAAAGSADAASGADATPGADAAPPSLSIADVSITEGNDAKNPTQASVTVTLSAPAASAIAITWETLPGSALGDDDFVPVTTGTASIPAGQTSATLTVDVVGDGTFEGDEALEVVITDAPGATIDDGAATVTIVDDESMPTLTVSDGSFQEGLAPGVLSFTVSLSGPSATAVSVDYSVLLITTSATDVAMTADTLLIPPGDTAIVVDIAVLADTLDEADETFQVKLAAPVGASFADEIGVGTIVDDDAPPHATMQDVVVVEGMSGTTTATVVVQLDAPSGLPIQLSYVTVNQTAVANTDYLSSAGQLVIPAGDMSLSINLSINGDTTPETNEAFRLDFSAPVNVVLDDTSAIVTITNDEVPTVTIADAMVTEGQAGTTAMVFQLTSTGSPIQTALSFSVNANTATAGADFVAASGQILFAPGETAKTLVVTVNADVLDEADETLSVAISSGQAMIPAPVATGTILDDDVPPTVSIGDATVTEGDAGNGTITFPVTLSAPSGRNVTVQLTRTLGTASLNDFPGAAPTVFTVPAGASSANLAIAIVNDTKDDEDAETFTITISSPLNAALGDTSGLGTILDNDPLPALSFVDGGRTEGNAGTASCTVQLTVSPPSNRQITYGLTTGGTATVAAANGPGVDLILISAVSVIAPGVAVQLLGGFCVGDTAFEPTETVTFTLSSPVNAIISDGTGVFTITNDDVMP